MNAPYRRHDDHLFTELERRAWDAYTDPTREYWLCVALVVLIIAVEVLHA